MLCSWREYRGMFCSPDMHPYSCLSVLIMENGVETRTRPTLVTLCGTAGGIGTARLGLAFSVTLCAGHQEFCWRRLFPLLAEQGLALVFLRCTTLFLPLSLVWTLPRISPAEILLASRSWFQCHVFSEASLIKLTAFPMCCSHCSLVPASAWCFHST